MMKLSLGKNEEQNSYNSHACTPSTSRSGLSPDISKTAKSAKDASLPEGDILSELEDDPFADSGSSYHPSDSEDGYYYIHKKTRKRKRNLIKIAQKFDTSLGSDQEIEQENSIDIAQKGIRKRAKKGQSEPSKWKRNTAKTLRKIGKEYEGKKR